MAMIDLQVFPDRLERAVEQVRERNIIIPTFAQMKDPGRLPARVRQALREVGLWDLSPLNLFQPDGRPGADHRPDRQVVPDRRAQGRRRV
jgi:hypothetical protein